MTELGAILSGRLRQDDCLELDRHFVSHDQARGDDDMWAEILASRQEKRDWNWLLEHRVIALLAEAGSGKSYEFRAQADRLNVNGTAAFYLRVEQLCKGDIGTVFVSPEQQSLFAQWRQDKGEAVFFLDSVDEAKLPNGPNSEPLRDALSALEHAVGPNLHRIRVVISCRGSEWYAQTEQLHVTAFAARIEQQLQAGKYAAAQQKLVRNLSFAPLDRARIAIIAAAKGATKRFLDILDEQELWDEVRTPMDAVHYVELFVDAAGNAEKEARLTSRSSVFEASVRRRLADRPDSRSRIDLSPEQALDAARFLAFAVTVFQQRDISFERPVNGALDVGGLFAEGPVTLSRQQIRQLLATPLFTPAGLGSVRFYRQEIEAYLAAEFLLPQFDLVPPLQMFRAFAVEKFGLRFVAQPFGPMLAWLATRNAQLLRSMAEVAPEFLIEEGDPRAIAIGDRAAALSRHVEATHENLPGSFYFMNRALARFAEPELEATVVALAKSCPQNEAQLHLLQLIRMGKYASAASWLEQISGEGFTPSEIRVYAIRALIACGTSDHLRRVATTWLAWGRPLIDDKGSAHISHREDDARIQLIAAAYPGAINLQTMLALLAQVNGREFPHNAELLAAMAGEAPVENLPALLDGLERLCWRTRPTTMFSHKEPKRTKRTELLFDALCEVLARMIELRPDDVRVESVDWVYTAGKNLRLDRDGEEWERISAALGKAPTVRSRMMRAAVAVDDARHPLMGLQDRLLRLWRSDHSALQVDIDNALKGYQASTDELRPQWTNLLVRWMGRTSKIEHQMRFIRLGMAAINHPLGVDWKTLNAVRWRPLGWASWLWFRYQRIYRWRLQSRLDGLKRKWHGKLQTYVFLARNWRKVGQGAFPFFLFNMLWDQGQDGVEQSSLQKHHGQLLARQLIIGTCAWVANIDPAIHYRYEIRWLNGLGLRWLSENDQKFPASLNQDAKRAATRHALMEGDDWPAWAGTLVDANRGLFVHEATAVLEAELNAGIRYERDHNSTALVRAANLPEDLKAALADDLLAFGENCNVLGRQDINYVADIVELREDLRSRLIALARRATNEALFEGQYRRGLKWLSVWARYEPVAIACFCDWLENVWRGDAEAEHSALMALGGMLGGRWNREGVQIADVPPQLRLRLARLVNIIVSFADDEPSREGIQNVTPRREREEVRRATENYLDADRSDEGWAVLLEFIANTIEPHYALWAQRWRASHARSAGNPTAWTIDQLRAFIRHGLVPPRNGDELMARVGEEIADIEARLQSSEFDRRALFTANTNESDFRAWLGHELEKRIEPWASITQETVTRGEKRTDLRIELRGGDRAILVIEIKLAHRWERAVLVDKVKSQLVDQYLIGDARLRHGIYLLADLGFPLKGALADGGTPDVHGFMPSLFEVAAVECVNGGNRVNAVLFKVYSQSAAKPRRRSKKAAK